jgi:hypothetical protein
MSLGRTMHKKLPGIWATRSCLGAARPKAWCLHRGTRGGVARDLVGTWHAWLCGQIGWVVRCTLCMALSWRTCVL